MEHREQDVVKAHGDSFAWIFDEASREDSAASSPAFIKWLSTNALGSIYWSVSFFSLLRNAFP